MTAYRGGQTGTMDSPVRLLWHWGTLGPYHFARMNAVSSQPAIVLTVVEDSNLDDHRWSDRCSSRSFRLITLNESVPRERLNHRRNACKLAHVLEREHPDVIVESLCDLDSLARVLAYAKTQHHAKLLLWTETTAWDRPRVWWREAIKRIVLSQFDGALVAGTQHAAYLRRLGFPPNRIILAGGCVDNNYFAHNTTRIRHCGLGRHIIGTDDPYFLFVGRLIPPKNVTGLISAYARYRQAVNKPWRLLIVGSGPQEAELREMVRIRRLAGIVFAGLRQTQELLTFYAHAGCFILPSLSEPWGLVVNEAMASGLPVIVSDRCGCAHELVIHGVTGFGFSPGSDHRLSALMEMISTSSVDLTALALNATARVGQFSPERHGKAAAELLQRLSHRPPVRTRPLSRLKLDLSLAALILRARALSLISPLLARRTWPPGAPVDLA